MTIDNLQVYLSDALDQEACKETLTTALKSRVCKLREIGTPDTIIVDRLECLCEDPYQLNDDVIFDVIEWIFLTTHHKDLLQQL